MPQVIRDIPAYWRGVDEDNDWWAVCPNDSSQGRKLYPWLVYVLYSKDANVQDKADPARLPFTSLDQVWATWDEYEVTEWFE